MLPSLGDQKNKQNKTKKHRVGWSVKTLFFVSGGKYDPKNTKISGKNWMSFEKKKRKNILIYFPKISAKILRFWLKIADFTRFWQNLKKKKSPKRENMSWSYP